VARAPHRSPGRPDGEPPGAARGPMGEDRPPAPSRGVGPPRPAPLVPAHRTGRTGRRTLADPLVPVRLPRRVALGADGRGRGALGRARRRRDRPASPRCVCTRPYRRSAYGSTFGSCSFDRALFPGGRTPVPASLLGSLDVYERPGRLPLLVSERLGRLDIRHRDDPLGSRGEDRDLIRRRAGWIASAGFGSSSRATHECVRLSPDHRDRGQPHVTGLPIDRRGRDRARCDHRCTDPLPRHHDRGSAREPSHLGPFPVRRGPPSIWMRSSGSSTRSGSPGPRTLPKYLGLSTYDFRVRNEWAGVCEP